MKQVNHRRPVFALSAVLALAAFLSMTPKASASLVGLLGPAGDYAILGINGAVTNLSSGPLRVFGNVGEGDGSQLNFSGGGQIVGRVDYAPSATLNTGGNTITGGTHQMSFSAVQQAVQSAVTFANSLSATQSFNSITSPMTLTSTTSQNVISIANDIHLSGGTLTLSGSASDCFILRINGTMELSGNTNIVLTGGLTANNVLWDFVGSGSQFQTSGQSQTAGIFLAPDRVININGGIHNSEFISGVSLSFQSNPQVTQPVPEVTPGAVIFGFLGLLVAISSRRVLAQRVRA